MQEVADIFGYSSKQTISDAEEKKKKKLRSVFISPRNKKDFHIFNGYNTLK